MICPNCHHDFTKTRKHQVNCADRCRLAAYRMRVSQQATIEAQAARIAELEAQIRALDESAGNGRGNAF